MQINVAHILQSLEASGALHRACRAQWAQQLALGIQASLERQIGVCSQVSDLAGSGQAADLLAMVYQLLNVDVLSTSLVALHSILSPNTLRRALTPLSHPGLLLSQCSVLKF